MIGPLKSCAQDHPLKSRARDQGVNDCYICFYPLRKLSFYSIATVKRKGKTEPALDYFCPILPYVRFYLTLLYFVDTLLAWTVKMAAKII